MSVSHPPTTTLSTRGRITLPKPVRDALGWDAGARLVVERTSEGVLLKPVASIPETDPEEVFGCLPFDGPPKSLADMEAGVMTEARRARPRNKSRARPRIASVLEATSSGER